MTPTELAQAIVDCGVGEIDPHMKLFPYGIACKDGSDHNWCTAEEFCTDGRVVLAMIMLCERISARKEHDGMWNVDAFAKTGSGVGINADPAIAINTACVEALK